MHRLLDLAYLGALLLLSPWLLLRLLRTGRYRRGLRDKLMGLGRTLPPGAVWFHGVSVGEVHLLRHVVTAFRRCHPDRACIISTTTDTGFDEARKAFPDLEVIYFPFDFSWAVRRTLDRVQPALVVLAESEIWPNFLRAVKQRGIALALINARMSPRSLARYSRVRPLVGWMFGSFDLIVAQSTEYQAALLALGGRPGQVHATGSVKYDGARTDRNDPRTVTLRRLLGIQPGERVWVAGSTQAPEEEIVVGIYQRARERFPDLRLLLVPRQPDRFESVAGLLRASGLPFARRSALVEGEPVPAVVLVDTMGELGAIWGLADVAFVGGSLDGRRGGQNMLEPAGYGAAVVFGPHVWNFKEPAARLVEGGAAWQVKDGAELESTVIRLLGDEGERRAMGELARAFVLRQQGATERTVELLGMVLPPVEPVSAERAA